MINKELINPTTYILNNKEYIYEGLFIHGYGSDKDEILDLALKTSAELKAKIVVFDLAGHGEDNTNFNFNNAIHSINKALSNLYKTDFIVGHSVGAYLSLITETSFRVLISMPKEDNFKGDKRELISTLRARRVREEKPYLGLSDVLNRDIEEPASSTFLIKAENDLASVEDFYSAWSNKNVTKKVINNTNHLDIINDKNTSKFLNNFLKDSLQ